MFIRGPIWSMIIQPRRVGKDARPRIKRAVHLTNVALVALVAAICWLIGWKEYLLIQAPTAMIAGSAGVFLFYVQHQFEDVYWEKHDDWSYANAALQGSSHLKLPQPFQFFTGNIGLHHVHHLSAKIPNYNLQRAHNENAFLHDVPTLTFWTGAKTVRLKLYDEDRGRMVTFSEARLPRSHAAAPA
jgi:omega-6 fatty acid desaturase (delta-12 desaturase)